MCISGRNIQGQHGYNFFSHKIPPPEMRQRGYMTPYVPIILNLNENQADLEVAKMHSGRRD